MTWSDSFNTSLWTERLDDPDDVGSKEMHRHFLMYFYWKAEFFALHYLFAIALHNYITFTVSHVCVYSGLTVLYSLLLHQEV